MHKQIVSPKTQKLINLYSDEVNQLLSEGYSEKDILTSSILDPQYYNRETIFMDDLLSQYMLNSDIETLKSLCCIDKKAHQLCQSNYFWKTKILHDGYLLLDEPSINSYIRIKNVTDIVLYIFNNNDDFDISINSIDLFYKIFSLRPRLLTHLEPYVVDTLSKHKYWTYTFEMKTNSLFFELDNGRYKRIKTSKSVLLMLFIASIYYTYTVEEVKDWAKDWVI